MPKYFNTKSQFLICCFQGFDDFIKNTFLFSHKSFLPCIFHNKSESTLVQSVSNNEKLHNKKVTNVFAPSLFYFDVYSEATCQVRSIFDSIGQLVKFLKINHKTLPGAVKLKIKPKTKKSGKK